MGRNKGKATSYTRASGFAQTTTTDEPQPEFRTSGSIDETPRVIAQASGSIEVRAPWVHAQGRYIVRRPSPRLSQRQGQALRNVFDGMALSNVPYNNREIRSPAEAICVLLERLADEMELDEHGERG